MTPSPSALSLVLHRHRGEYRFDLPGPAGATLRARGGMRRGVITTSSGTWAIAVNDFSRSGVTVGPAGEPMVRLGAGLSVVPDGPVQWSMGRTARGYQATISRGADRISVRQTALLGQTIRVEVAGLWAHLELVLLSACFAVMTRRRGDRLRTLAVVGATGHGPG